MALEPSLIPATVFAAVLLWCLGLHNLTQGGRQEARRRLEEQAPPLAKPGAEGSVLISAGHRPLGALEGWLRHHELGRRWAADLMQADLPWRVSEYLAVRFALAAGFLLLGLLLSRNSLTIALLTLLGVALPGLFLQYRQQQRFTQIADQLPDALTVLTTSLKVGHGLLQALDDVARELSPPIAGEFARVVREVRLGADLEEALLRLTMRAQSYDLELVVTAMLLQRVTGGNLAEVLDNIAHTIRERLRIQGEVRTLTAEGRLSGWILGLLPLALLAALQVLQPEYLAPLFHTGQGRLLLGAAAGLELVGFLVIRKLVTIEV